ncbi:MAG: hypothetical protein KF712_16770 [Akkermansiaceae bacterium]|nr:hypothetical protein [Akkermansiaceae bacterium]
MGDFLETFQERLSNLCESDGGGDEPRSGGWEESHTEQICAIADSLGILERPDYTFQELISQSGIFLGTEHVVELDTVDSRVSKITRPPAFGLYPTLVERQGLPLPSGRLIETQRQIELVGSSLSKYLLRWAYSNQVFGDDVRLSSLIRWADGALSVGITQPQYHGRKASESEIMEFFVRKGWRDVTRRAVRAAFYQPDFNLVAVDAEPRNCFINTEGLFPFDVVLADAGPDLLEIILKR